MKLAYVLNTYPQPSHSFIRRELLALEADGADVVRLAMRPADATLVDAGDIAEAARTRYVLAQGALGLLGALLRQATKAPSATMAAVKLAVRLGRASHVGVLRHMIYLAEAAFVAQACKAGGVQHMHAHFGTNAAAVAMLVQAMGGPSYSFTVHGPEEFDAPGALSLGLKLDRAAFAVGVSEFGRSQLSRWAAFATWPRLKVVHCGIVPEAFDDPKPLPSGPLRLVAIGRFVEQKGQMKLVQAMAEVIKIHADVHLALVGDGEMRGDLERAIIEGGMTENVTLTGWLDEAGVRDQLAAAHALVMPSFAEGLPMVVMEAMAAARPVIATYIAGTPELVQPGKTGWLVPAGDVGALAGAMVEAAQTPPETLRAMGQDGRTRVLARHDATKEAAKLADHFRAAIKG
ncbi:MAG: glycosyltransferase [Sedimentitalea sp.]